MDILTKLGINWQLLLAQIVNFAIIAGILAYFVYRPILNLIDARRERIRKAMEDAERIEAQKKEFEVTRQEEMSKIDKQAGEMLEKAKKQAEKMKVEIVDAARKEADDILAKGKQQLAAERRQVFEEVQATLTTMIVRMTEKILEREFTPADQKRLIASLEKELPSSAK